MTGNSVTKKEFTRKYSFLVEISENSFVGYYNGKYKVQVALPKFPEMDKMRIMVFEGMDRINIEMVPDLSNIIDYMDNLIAYLNTHETQPSKSDIADVTRFDNIIQQMIRIKHEHLCKIHTDKSISKIKLNGFQLNENHYLEMHRVSGSEFQVLSHSLPDIGSAELFKWHASPETHACSFVQILNQLQEFYNNLHTLDELCHVVDPPEIDTRTTWRIIRFSQKIFFKITLHPLQPSSVVIAFIGPTIEVEYLRELYNSKREDWDPESDVYTNLLRIFEIMSFPMRTEQDGKESEPTHCGICMSYRDNNNKIPIISCDNDKCSLIFHIDCLKQWFLSVKESKTFFAISIGTCPYCKQKVSSSFDELLVNLT